MNCSFRPWTHFVAKLNTVNEIEIGQNILSPRAFERVVLGRMSNNNESRGQN